MLQIDFMKLTDAILVALGTAVEAYFKPYEEFSRRRLSLYGFDDKTIDRILGTGRISNEFLRDKQSARATLSRMRKLGYVTKEKGEWRIAVKGKKHFKTKWEWKHLPSVVQNISNIENWSKRKRNLIIFFDVPEHERIKRDWLRRELRVLGFVMKQQSVWFGPGPLPEIFIESLKETDILKYIQMFGVTEEKIV